MSANKSSSFCSIELDRGLFCADDAIVGDGEVEVGVAVDNGGAVEVVAFIVDVAGNVVEAVDVVETVFKLLGCGSSSSSKLFRNKVNSRD